MQASPHPTGAVPPRTPQGYDMNRLYLSQSQQQSIRPGVFLKRNERIDWRRIAAVDLDRIIRDLDFQTLQDNLEHITLCNIDAEVDMRVMDPNFVKLYKMAQLTIEYLLMCQDQISAQLGDYEQLKIEAAHEQTSTGQHIQNLNDELAEAKKELKKRRKMLETQQRMLMAQNSNYHTCPVCTHAFLSVTYLQSHIKRRHPGYEPIRSREHDVDIEKEVQRLKDELNKKETEVQVIKAEKRADEDKIRDRDSNIRQLKEEIQTLTTKLTISDDRLLQFRTNALKQPHRPHEDSFESLEDNKDSRATIKELKQALEQARVNLTTQEELRKKLERRNEKHLKEIDELNEHLQLIQTPSGDYGNLSRELFHFKNLYNEEKLRSATLERALQEAHEELAQYKKQPPPISGRKSPVLPIRPTDPLGEIPVHNRHGRPVQGSVIMLSDYCPTLIERLKQNPKYLSQFREDSKKLFVEELENLGISENDTRLTDLDYRTKVESMLQTRRNIQRDLPDFEHIRGNIARTLDKRVDERINLRQSMTSIRSAGSKLVTFQDERHQSKYPSSTFDTTKHHSPDRHGSTKTNQTKLKLDDSRPHVKHESDDDTMSNTDESDEDIQHTRPGVKLDIQPSPRKNIPQPKPTNGISALVTGGIAPSPTREGSTIAAIVRQPLAKPTSTVKKLHSDSERESPIPSASPGTPHTQGVAEKKRIIEQKLHEATIKGEKPFVNAVAQGFMPSKTSQAAQHDEDDDDDDSFTTLNTNPLSKQGNSHLPQVSGRDLANNNLQSSGDMSHTYGSLWKSQPNKAAELRRPLTGDSTKTSNMDSDENDEVDESN